ncbi:hypothetical protein IL306_004492 [Fusarium sp. DS 682]|nr:hypothetical protein IL306_004492 [Fusarium sp. DS 682]
MKPQPCEAPAPYDDFGVSRASVQVQKCVDRIYKASGKRLSEWLPRDYVPKASNWGSCAARHLTLAVEAVCAKGSKVTMDELRDFLVNRAKERQESSKNGMHSECFKARLWVESRNGISQSPAKQKSPEQLRHKVLVREARAVAKRRINAAHKRRPQDELGDESEYEDDDDDDEDELSGAIDYDRKLRDMSVLSDISNVSSTIGVPTRRQLSLPPVPDWTSTPKRPMAPPTSPLAEKRMRLAEQPAPDDDDGPGEDSNSVPADDEYGFGQIEAAHLYAINSYLRATCEKIEDAEYCKRIYVQDLTKVQMDLCSINIQEINDVLQAAIEDRDKKRKELSQLQDASSDLAKIIQINRENCAEKLRTCYNTLILDYENAREELKKKEDTLKAMEDETQRDREIYQNGLEYIACLGQQVAEQEETIKKETRTKKILMTSQFHLGFINRLYSASDEMVDEEYNAAMKKQESML